MSFFGIIITLNRLYVTNEMTIIKLNGFSNYHLARILSILIMFVTIFMIILKFFLAPLAVEHRSKIEHQISHEQKIYSLKEGIFNISNDKSKVVLKFEESEKGYKNFTVVENKINEIDWLYLEISGHRRLNLLFQNNKPQFQWLIP